MGTKQCLFFSQLLTLTFTNAMEMKNNFWGSLTQAEPVDGIFADCIDVPNNETKAAFDDGSMVIISPNPKPNPIKFKSDI